MDAPQTPRGTAWQGETRSARRLARHALRACYALLRARESRGKVRKLGAGRATVWIPQAACNDVAGPFPGFPEGLAPEAGARRVAALAKA